VISKDKPVPRSQELNAFAAGNEAAKDRLRSQRAFWLAAVQAKNNQPSIPGASPAAPTAAAANPSSPWDCIAEAETGSDYTMHGSTYSTAFGMVNDIIYQYGTPEEQSAVFSGTATKAQQIDIASRFAADHGFGGWGSLTKQKCGL
jgi:hypothetical protein